MAGLTPLLKSVKRVRDELRKSGATKKEETINKLAGVLRELTVVSEEKLAERKESGSEQTSPIPILNLILRPNATE
jgi:hypothetical protein